MKGMGKANKILIGTAIALFVLINTQYFWIDKLGVNEMLVLLILCFIFFILAVSLIPYAYFLLVERFKNKGDNITVVVIVCVLAIIWLKPFGLINFYSAENEKSILYANREGAANCMTTFKLLEDNKFAERSVCFGTSEVKGKYEIINDTIFFSDITLERHNEDVEYYEFAIIDKSKINDGGGIFFYKNHSDTLPKELWVKENNL